MKYKAFTLIEILVVIGLIAVLASATIIAINPQRNFRQARDNERRSEANAILSAISQYLVDNQNTVDLLESESGLSKGAPAPGDDFRIYPCSLGTTDIIIDEDILPGPPNGVIDNGPPAHGGGGVLYADSIDFQNAFNIVASSGPLVPEFIPAIPKDPLIGVNYDTGYDICLDDERRRFTITAPLAEVSTVEVIR